MASTFISEISALEFGRFRQMIQRVPQMQSLDISLVASRMRTGCGKAAGLMRARQ
jgi:hypothetical protein